MIIGMNKKLFKQLCMNYNKEADKELYELWEYNLRCYDEEELSKAINIIIANDKYFPTLNRILEVVKDIVNKESIEYDEKYMKEKMINSGVVPEWFNKDIANQEIDKQTKKEYDEFMGFIEVFRK